MWNLGRCGPSFCLLIFTRNKDEELFESFLLVFALKIEAYSNYSEQQNSSILRHDSCFFLLNSQSKSSMRGRRHGFICQRTTFFMLSQYILCQLISQPRVAPTSCKGRSSPPFPVGRKVPCREKFGHMEKCCF